MHEKVEDLFAKKTQRQENIRQNKLPVPLLSLLLQILFNVNFSIRIFTSNIAKNFKRYFLISCSFSLIVTFYNFSNTFFGARILHKISEPFTFFEH